MSDNITMSSSTLCVERNNKIDWMRTLGTLLVILAHMEIPSLLSELRTFDVVMLVMISGYSFAVSYSCNPKPLRTYLLKRFNKLIIPVWIMITVLFAGSFVACNIVGRTQLYSIYTVGQSYIFGDGIGYIWIAKVYFMIAAVSYALYRLVSFIKSDAVFLTAISVYVVAYQMLMLTSIKTIYAFSEYVFYLLAYSTIAMIGMRCFINKEFIQKAAIYSVIVFVVLQCICIMKNIGFAPGEYKFPPEIYYLFYGLAVGFVLYIVIPDVKVEWNKWFSSNSYTIYLFHVLIMLCYRMIVDTIGLDFFAKWYVEYPVVIVGSIVATIALHRIKFYFGRIENDKAKAKK